MASVSLNSERPSALRLSPLLTLGEKALERKGFWEETACHTKVSLCLGSGTKEHSLEANEADTVSLSHGRQNRALSVGTRRLVMRRTFVCALPSSEKQTVCLAVLQMCFDEGTENTFRPPFRRYYSSEDLTMRPGTQQKNWTNAILLLIPFEETNSIKQLFKSRNLFVV